MLSTITLCIDVIMTAKRQKYNTPKPRKHSPLKYIGTVSQVSVLNKTKETKSLRRVYKRFIERNT